MYKLTVTDGRTEPNYRKASLFKKLYTYKILLTGIKYLKISNIVFSSKQCIYNIISQLWTHTTMKFKNFKNLPNKLWKMFEFNFKMLTKMRITWCFLLLIFAVDGIHSIKVNHFWLYSKWSFFIVYNYIDNMSALIPSYLFSIVDKNI